MSQRIKDWFERFEKVLLTEAECAGLIEHGPTVGQIREFFLKSVLEKFLPSGLTVGSGKIISSRNEQISNQIDIIIFDNRFPKYSITGSSNNALYPIEGVIATIEVKSTLDSESLNNALDNCYSVMSLPLRSKHEDIEREKKKIMKQHKINEKQAKDMLFWRFLPKTYIFAFKGYKKNLKDFNNAILNWMKEKPISYYAPKIPNVIVGEGVIGLTHDHWIHLINNSIFSAHLIDIKFGLLASHLLSVIYDRIDTRHAYLRMPYSTEGYSVFHVYDNIIRESKSLGIAYTPKNEKI